MDIQAVLLGGVFGFATSIVTAILLFRAATSTNTNNANIAAREQSAIRRTKRYEYLLELMQLLIKSKHEYEHWTGTHEDFKEKPGGWQEARGHHARIIGQAIAACLASGDTELQKIAGDDLVPYTDGRPDLAEVMNSNRKGIHEAMIKLSTTINTLTATD